MKRVVIFLLILSGQIFGQDSTNADVNLAYLNALKGMNWALHNIPEKKLRLDNDLIEQNMLYSSIKVSKEVNGYKIESIGFYLNTESTIKVYRSDDWLIKYGYIKPPVIEQPIKEEKKTTTLKGRKKQKSQ